jgi:hypothetical protein
MHLFDFFSGPRSQEPFTQQEESVFYFADDRLQEARPSPQSTDHLDTL